MEMEEATIDNPPGRDHTDTMLQISAEGGRPLLQNADDRRDGEHPLFSIVIHEAVLSPPLFGDACDGDENGNKWRRAIEFFRRDTRRAGDYFFFFSSLAGQSAISFCPQDIEMEQYR